MFSRANRVCRATNHAHTPADAHVQEDEAIGPEVPNEGHTQLRRHVGNDGPEVPDA